MNEPLREEFERWVQRPPMERSIERLGPDSAWPGAYKDYPVHLAWEAWCAAREWRPISTVSTDDYDCVLGWIEDEYESGPEVVWWDQKLKAWCRVHDDGLEPLDISHWLPVPPDPIELQPVRKGKP